MEGSEKLSGQGLWRIGVLLEASAQAPVKKDPMRVVEAVSGQADSRTATIALCKQHLLGTYDLVNDYTSPSSGQVHTCMV